MPKIARRKAAKPHKCGRCAKTIEKGEEYFTFNKRTSYKPPRGVVVKRCIDHYPRPSETTGNPRRAQVYGIVENLEDEAARLRDESQQIDPSEFESVIEDATEEVRSIAEEMREGAENMESGFGWATEQSDELAERADAVEEVVSELEGLDLPEPPDEPDMELEGEPEEPDPDMYESEEEYQQAYTDYESDRDDYQDRAEAHDDYLEEVKTWREEAADVIDEAAGFINDMEV